MTKKELYLKTVFCCMACDGNIAKEEVELVKELSANNALFEGMDAEKYINLWITEINAKESTFLLSYLKEVKVAELNEQEQMQLLNLALMTIEADNVIEYAEVKFFKKIRTRLSISDEAILALHPGKEDFLLPDINVEEEPFWDTNTSFADISFGVLPSKSNER